MLGVVGPDCTVHRSGHRKHVAIISVAALVRAACMWPGLDIYILHSTRRLWVRETWILLTEATTHTVNQLKLIYIGTGNRIVRAQALLIAAHEI